MMNARTKSRTGVDQFVRVVAVRAADDHDHVAFLRQFHRRALALFRRLADGVHEAHFGLREIARAINRTSCRTLSMGCVVCAMTPKRGRSRRFANVVFAKHDVEFVQIFRHAAHFHMVALADDDRMKPFAHQFRQAAVRHVNERAGGFQHLQARVRAPRPARVPTRRAP